MSVLRRRVDSRTAQAQAEAEQANVTAAGAQLLLAAVVARQSNRRLRIRRTRLEEVKVGMVLVRWVDPANGDVVLELRTAGVDHAAMPMTPVPKEPV